MNVSDLMSREVRSVRLVDRLDAAARAMWEQDCGCVPVVDAGGVLAGVVTDRDVCMAAYTQGRPLGEIPVATAMARVLRTCRTEDTLASACATLQQAQVHRLPVVDARGVLVGMLTLNDLVRAAAARPAAIDGTLVLKVLAAVSAPRKVATAKAQPAVVAVAAAPALAAEVASPAPAARAPIAPATPPAPAAPPAAPAAAPRAAAGKPAPKKRGKKG